MSKRFKKFENFEGSDLPEYIEDLCRQYNNDYNAIINDVLETFGCNERKFLMELIKTYQW